ncbi:MAG: hypothetical protein JWL71_3309 [Acidobacteria bacterium]|nr:hypothetical protein [Acidobacteriota bacterium]
MCLWYPRCLAKRQATMRKSPTRRPDPTANRRARRFPIHAAVRYRASHGPWREGTTENISRSGLLLRAKEPLTPDASLEVVVALPPPAPGVPSAMMLCRGRVSRTVEPTDVAGILLGLSITSCRIGRFDPSPVEPCDT